MAASSNALLVYQALLAAGASAVQALGIMGNLQAESGFDPEASAIDSNGLRSNGLAQWNTGSYPNSGSMLTGNVQQDITTQIQFLVSTGGLGAATGSTPAEVAQNFAHTYERCAACGYQGGTSQLTARANNASQLAADAKSGNWPNASNVSTAGATLTSSTGSGSSTSSTGSAGCALKFPTVVAGSVCIITKSELKAAKGGLLMAAGGIMFGLGAVVLVAFAFQRTSAGRAASQAVKATPIAKVARVPKARAAERRQDRATSRRVAVAGARTAETQARSAAASQRSSERLIQLKQQQSGRQVDIAERGRQQRRTITHRARQQRVTEGRRHQNRMQQSEARASQSRYRAASRRNVTTLEPGEEPF